MNTEKWFLARFNVRCSGLQPSHTEKENRTDNIVRTTCILQILHQKGKDEKKEEKKYIIVIYEL